MFENIKNSIDFYIRNITKFSRKNFIEKNTKNIERNILENLYTKAILEKYFKKPQKENIKILDIGCKNWFYAKGEWEFFNTFCNDFSLDGVEIDPYRLYSNLYSRYEVAKFYIKDLKNTTYIKGNLLNLSQNYDYIIWFLPFLFKKSHTLWGLPQKYFHPEKLLNHAYSLLENGGEMLIVNQGEKEAQVQTELLNKLNIPYKSLGEIKNEHFAYQNKRFGFIIRK